MTRIGSLGRHASRISLAVVLLACSINCHAATFSLLHSFGIPHCQGSSPDGALPGGVVLGSDGLIHGITYAGPYVPTVNNGSIFTIDPGSGAFSTTFEFTATTDGSQPSGVLTQLGDGSFYGTNISSGALPGISGTVFHYVPGTGLSTVYAFAPAFDIYVSLANADGANPDSGVTIGSDGTLWGTTRNGGADGNGTVFHLDPGTHQLTTIHGFSIRAVQNFGTNEDGANPIGKLVLAKDHNYFGVTTQGGPGQTGTIYQVNPATGTFTVVYGFSGFTDLLSHNADGANPSAGLTLASDGTLYGVTCSGGSDASGTAFRFDPTTGRTTIVHTFTSAQAACPTSTLLLASDGNFYGTATRAPSASGAIFRMSPAGAVTVLHALDLAYPDPAGCGGYVNVDGSLPYNALIEGRNGDLIGSAESGGEGNSGTVFVMRGAIPVGTSSGGGGPTSSSGGGGGAMDMTSLTLLAGLLALRRRRTAIGFHRTTTYRPGHCPAPQATGKPARGARVPMPPGPPLRQARTANLE